MPAYFDDKRKKWYAKFSIHGHQFKKTGFATKKAALAYERDFIAQHKGSVDMPFEAFVEVYFQDKGNRLKEISRENYEKIFRNHITPFFRSQRLNDITSADIYAWQSAELDKGLTEATQLLHQTLLITLFKHAERYYQLSPNPCSNIDRIGSAKKAKVDFWTRPEYEQFISTIDNPKYHALFELLFWSGMRIGEALALTPADFDFEERNVTINKTYHRIRRQDIITSPKTDAANRTVDLPVFVCDEIRSYLDRLYSFPDDERIFDVCQTSVEDRFHAYTDMTHLKRIRVHDLRHSHVAMLIDMGVQPMVIAERVGHESINTTLNVYGHLYPSAQKDICDRLANLRK